MRVMGERVDREGGLATVKSEGWTTTENIVRGIYCCMEYI